MSQRQFTFGREKIEDTHDEVEALVRDYFARTKASEDTPPLEFNWHSYVVMERQGMIVLGTVRQNTTKLVGFVFYIVAPHPHHCSIITAHCDMIAVNPDFRGMGLGTLLVEHGVRLLKCIGVSMVIHGYRHTYDADTTPLFSRLGFRAIETMYRKDIGQRVEEERTSLRKWGWIT